MQEFLVVSAIGEDKPGIINALSQVATESGCNILDTRMTVLGGEFALLMMLNGAEAAIIKASDQFPAVADRFGLTTILKRTQPRRVNQAARPYRVNVVALDHPGIVREIAGFFGNRQINIEEMETGTYAAAHTGTPMFSLEMTVNVPATIPIAGLKDAFVTFCDERNLDASIEPRR
ncbi:MAG: glycine cleavage system protein R [Gammaproteobacteria bacterium]|jgi:glycine cleavage system transcriptional repressor|nr:glycine cleavage system protein R [Gammaproteobacteria bacterium]